MASTSRSSGARYGEYRAALRALLGSPVTWMSLVAVAFALNIAWEYAQAPLYGGGDPYDLSWWVFLRASAADAAFIAAATGVALVVRRWWRPGFWVVVVVGLAAVAAGIELHAQFTGRWSYGPAMPTVGPVGLSPLVQLPLLGTVTNAVVRPWRAHRAAAGDGGRRGRSGGDGHRSAQRADGEERLRGRVATVLFSPRTRLIVLAVVVIGAAVAFALFGGPSQSDIQQAIRLAGPAAPLAFVALYAVLTVLMFPGSLLTIAAGALFGPALGTVLAVTGASLGASLAYLVGRRLGREQVARLAGGRRRIGAIDAWLGRRGFVAVLYARLIPVVPFNVLNYAAGVTSVRFRAYLPATVVGMVPGAFAYAALGGSFRDPTSPVFLAAVSLIAVLLIAGPFVNRWLRARGVVPDDEPAEGAAGDSGGEGRYTRRRYLS